jgi:very-short-patch-repair endonuclease
MTGAYWDRIRRHYAAVEQLLLTSRSRWGIDPYAWDFQAGIRMTPIEAALWHDIRAECAVLYPQFPVAGHFVDFGNPAAKVAIECDGAAFHQDAARDRARQQRIESAGWTVLRLTGSECSATDRYYVDAEGRDRLEIGPARRLIRSAVLDHGIGEV